MISNAKRMVFVLTGLLALGIFTANADVILLTTNGAQGGGQTSGGATFVVQQVSSQSTGTGVINPFLRIHSNSDTEAGYNTDGVSVLDDVSSGGAHLSLLSLSDIPTVNLNGVSYGQFLLDVNQTGSNPIISLNQVIIFTGGAAPTTFGGTPCDSTQGQTKQGVPTGTPSCTSTTVPDITLSGLTPVFTMSSSNKRFDVQIDSSLNSGSGSGDMFLYVPTGLFSGDYVTLFSQFGTPPGGYAQNDGYEEWSTLTNATSVPDGGVTLMLLGGALVGLETLRRRFRV